MSTILERLREALAPDLQVEREIAGGGMGIVFAARDRMLDRPVAIKILRPEQATARAAEKFLREARILANLRHPNVIPVHRAGEADGFFYYVMDLVTEGTLAERLKDGPLPPEEALKLGRDLLDALETVHDLGVVHRDIKPSNIFLVGNRAVLTDFGIAKPSKDPMDITATEGSVAGTVGYMPPEQAYGLAVTGRTDLYAVAMVLYEAYTGRRWSDTPPDATPNWAGVPAKVVPVLQQALAWEPERRWPDAATFRKALWRTRTLRYKRYKWYATAVAATTLGIGILLGWLWLKPARTAGDLAIMPFSSATGVDPALATNLRILTETHLRDFAHLAQYHVVDDWWRSHGGSRDSIGPRMLDALGVQHAAHARLEPDGDTVTISVDVLDGQNGWQHAGTMRTSRSGEDLEETGHQIGFHIARLTNPNRVYVGSPALAARTDRALNAFLRGQQAFRQNAFATATGQFELALAEDPGFGLAAWWLSNAWRWKATGEPYPGLNLARVLEEQGADLPELDRLLIEAQLAPTPTRRFEVYSEALERFPRDAFSASLYAEELLNRGALSGIPIESTIAQLELAVTRDSSFAPALGNLVWAYTRAGNRAQARRALDRYATFAAGPEEVGVYQPLLLEFAFTERFAPDNAQNMRAAMLSRPTTISDLQSNLRLAPMFGLAKTQADLAFRFLGDHSLLDEQRASLHEARGLGLVAMGRIEEALTHLDSAALLFGTPTSRLEANEWRIVLALLEVPGLALSEAAERTAALDEIEHDVTLRSRAAWATGLKAAARGDRTAAGVALSRLESDRADTTAQRLANLLDAVLHGSAGNFIRALEISEPLLAFDSAAHGGDPFARAVLHIKRADWLESLGRHEAADSMRLWYQHFEVIRIPVSEAVAADIDWALATYATWLRGTAAAAQGDKRSACQRLMRVVELWSDADAAYASRRDSARTLIAGLGCLP